MGFFSSCGSMFGFLSSSSSSKETAETPASLRKKHGFSDFSAEMKRMQAFDPEKEMDKDSKTPLRRTTAPSNSLSRMKK